MKETQIKSMMAKSVIRTVTLFLIWTKKKEIIELIIDKNTTNEIAEKLFISEKAVETHRKNLLRILNVQNTAGLVRIVLEKGLLG